MSDILGEQNINAYVDSPLAFVRAAYPWGIAGSPLEHVKGPDPWQAEALRRIGRLKTGEFFFPTGNGPGKTTLLAWLAHWAVTTRRDCCVAAGGGSSGTSDILRREIGKWIAYAYLDIRFPRLESTKSDHVCRATESRIEVVRALSEGVAVFHASSLIYLFDEAGFIPGRIWDTARACINSVDEGMIVATNTGIGPEGSEFRRATERVLNVDTRTVVDRVRQEQIDAWTADYGEDSEFVRTRIKGW